MNDESLSLISFIIFIAWLFIIIYGLLKPDNTEFNQWLQKCRDDGGFVTLTSYNPNHYECIKDGQIINHVN